MAFTHQNIGWRVAHILCAVAGSSIASLERALQPSPVGAAAMVLGGGVALMASGYCAARAQWTILDWYTIRAGKLVWGWDEDNARSFARGCFWAAGILIAAVGIYRLVVRD